MSGVQSIQRAFAILRALALGQAGVTELSERAEIPKSTVARMLNALEAEGAVEQVESWGEYRLGATIVELASAAQPGESLVGTSRPYLWELTETTGETSGVSVLGEDGAVFYLDHVESEEEVQVRSWTGEKVAAHLVPSGLVLLAHCGDDELNGHLSRPLEATTDKSVTDPDRIRTRLEEIRSANMVWVYGEFDDSINSVAAPLRNRSGQVVAALHVHGPAYRFPAEGTADKVAAALGDTAARLSRRLH